MQPLMIPMTPDMLREMMGTPQELFVCQMPVPDEAAVVIFETIARGSMVRNALSRYPDLDPGIRETLETLGVLVEIVDQGIVSGSIFSAPWRDLSGLLEDKRATLPEGLPKEVIAEYDLLIDNLSKCSRFLAVERFTIEFRGGERELKELTAQLAEVAIDLAEDTQAELAEQYGWTRGKTHCCDDVGYNPPDGVSLPSVHDPKTLEDQSEQAKLRAVLSRLTQGFGQRR